MKSKIIISLIVSILLIYLFYADYLFTLNIYDTYYLISYFYIALAVVFCVSILFLFKKRNSQNL